jgi:hypothetical protein
MNSRNLLSFWYLIAFLLAAKHLLFNLFLENNKDLRPQASVFRIDPQMGEEFFPQGRKATEM